MKNIMRIATSSLALAGGLGLAGLGAAAVAEAQPIAPTYHWCPGEGWDPGWGPNWDGGRCHDDFYRDGDPRDQGHWRGSGDRDHWQGGPGDRDHWQGGPGDRDHWQGGPGDRDHGQGGGQGDRH